MRHQLTEIVRRAGQLSLRYFRSGKDLDVSYKNPLDIVTNADREVEAFLQRELLQLCPDADFVGEESGTTINEGRAGRFVVDPIDGTSNFFHGYPFYSVSVGYFEAGRARCAAVYCPPMDEMFSAVLGEGARRNGEAIHVSATQRLDRALATTGFACIRSGLKPNSLPIFNHMVHKVRDLHRDGSAAMDLCYLACGVYDLYWEYNLSPWDIAAGILILTEAGGTVTDFSGGSDWEKQKRLLASNGHLHAEVLKAVNDLS